MTENYVVAIEGLETRPIESLSADVLTAAYRAINRTATKARTSGAREIGKQVAFSPSYLNPSQGRLVVSSQANSSNLEARISARTRPTSLARFVTSGSVGQTGVSVEVAPGFAKFMKRAFLIRLRAGTADLETKSNLGLAIRLKPGEVIQNKRVFTPLGKNLYLLYGPSVSQVFTTVREDISPEIADNLSAEFVRLINLKGAE